MSVASLVIIMSLFSADDVAAELLVVAQVPAVVVVNRLCHITAKTIAVYVAQDCQLNSRRLGYLHYGCRVGDCDHLWCREAYKARQLPCAARQNTRW